MPFKRALYYPHIDINDDTWLKNALLFWEEVCTIVPESVEEPYTNDTSRYFSDQSLLSPLVVNPRMEEIEALAETAIDHLFSQESITLYASPQRNDFANIHPDKLPRDIQRFIDIHPDKLPVLLNNIYKTLNNDGNNGWMRVPARFGYYYMTILAANLAGHRGLSLVTNQGAAEQLANSVRFDLAGALTGHYPLYPYLHRRHRHRRNATALAEGIITRLLLDGFGVPPDTPAPQIVSFRRNYQDELNRFKRELNQLIRVAELNEPYEEIVHQAESLYNDVVQALSDLKQALKGTLTTNLTRAVLQLCFVAVPATLGAVTYTGASPAMPLILGTGLSLTASSVFYNVQKEAMLRNSPYSYLYYLENELTLRGD